jgi:hypothetical protein
VLLAVDHGRVLILPPERPLLASEGNDCSLPWRMAMSGHCSSADRHSPRKDRNRYHSFMKVSAADAKISSPVSSGQSRKGNPYHLSPRYAGSGYRPYGKSEPRKTEVRHAEGQSYPVIVNDSGWWKPMIGRRAGRVPGRPLLNAVHTRYCQIHVGRPYCPSGDHLPGHHAVIEL